nr:MAG TPA: hypothetical protein [Bacteriophage sp.]
MLQGVHVHHQSLRFLLTSKLLYSLASSNVIGLTLHLNPPNSSCISTLVRSTSCSIRFFDPTSTSITGWIRFSITFFRFDSL